jgi:plasmid stabilization system protein ParE
MRLSEMRTEVTPQKINKIVESRFGFTIDYDNLTYAKAKRLAQALGENITQIKRSFGAHTAEKNSKYMELMLVKEGLDKWLSSEQGLFESEMGRSEAVLAAKDITDSIQDMLEKVSKMQNEQVPALVDTIRDQIGMEQAEAFKNAIRPVLDSLYQTMTSGRESADTASRALAGEQIGAGDMSMGLGGDDLGADANLGGADLSAAPGADLGAAPESDLDQDTDGFDATDAAAGGSADLGRTRR